MEHSDDVSDVNAKTLILNHKMCFLGLLIFTVLLLKVCLKIVLTIGAWFKLPICIKKIMYCLDLRINLDWA